jgi:hypothetical protein
VAPRHLVVVVLAAYLGFALVVAGATPPWESVDEAAHVHNVEALVEGHWYRIRPGSGTEPHQAPLYYLTLAGWQRLIALEAREPAPTPGCRFFFDPCHNQFAHDVAHDGVDQRFVFLLRLPGVALGLAAVVLTGLAARRISRDPWTPVVAMAIVALFPRFLFLSGVVNNDNLANALAAAATLLALIAVTGGRLDSARDRLVPIGLGVVVGALLLAKMTALALAPGMLLAAYLSGTERRDGLRRVGIVAAVGLLVSGAWLVFNQIEYGDPLALRATRRYLIEDQSELFFATAPTLKVLFVENPKEFYKAFWYESGWGFLWAWWAYVPFWLLTAVGLAGLFGRRLGRALPVLAAMVVVPIALYWALSLDTPTASPRLALIAVPALACLIAVGFERLPLPVAARFLLPALGAVGIMIAIRQDVVGLPGNRPLPHGHAEQRPRQDLARLLDVLGHHHQHEKADHPRQGGRSDRAAGRVEPHEPDRGSEQDAAESTQEQQPAQRALLLEDLQVAVVGVLASSPLHRGSSERPDAGTQGLVGDRLQRVLPAVEARGHRVVRERPGQPRGSPFGAWGDLAGDQGRGVLAARHEHDERDRVRA